MKKRLVRVFAVGLTVMTLTASVVGCNKGDSKKETTAPQTSTATNAKPGGLPIVDKSIKVKGWMGLHDNHKVAGVNSLEDVLAFQELEKRTNIDIEWTCVTDANKQFGLMVASGEWPDFFWAGGSLVEPNRHIESDLIMPLNELIDQHAPNLKKIYEQLPMLKKEAMDFEGKIWSVTQYNHSADVKTGNLHRLVIRKDWLDKVGLKMPETQDELYTVLKAFKEKDPNGNGKKDELPFSDVGFTYAALPGRSLCFWPLGVGERYYQVDGKVKFGPLEPDFKKGVEFGKKLFSEGLIDVDTLTQKEPALKQKVADNLVGMSANNYWNHFTSYADLAKQKTPGYAAEIMPFMKASDGKRYVWLDNGHKFGGVIFITKTTKYAKEIMKWLDYQFTEEGSNLMSYGVEGKSYDMVNGKPVFKTELLNGADGKSVIANRSKYTAGGAGAFGWPMYDKPFEKENGKWPVEMTNLLNGNQEVFDKVVNAKKIADLTRLASFSDKYTKKESELYASKWNDLNTFIEESVLKFMLGATPMDKYDDFLKEMKKMGAEELLAIRQAAYDRMSKK